MKKKLIIIGIILIVISFVTFIVLINMDEVTTKSVDNTSIDDNEINDTLDDDEIKNNDETEVYDSNSKLEDDILGETDKPNDNNDSNDGGNSSTEDKPNDNSNGNNSKPEDNTGGSSNNNNNSTNDTKPQEPEVVLTELEQIVLDIKNDYGVKVLYHNDAYVTVNGVSGVKTTESDEELILKNVKAVQTNLSYIPDVILNSMLNNGGYYIMMMKEIPGSIEGYAVRAGVYGDYHIVLELDDSGIDRIFYHETWHLIESDMRRKNSTVFNGWEDMNPAGFSYGDFGELYIPYGDTTVEKDIAFVTDYAKTDAEEDRCELFADLMFKLRKYTYMNTGYGINEKAIHLSDLIDQVYGNINNARWDRWISF